MNKVAKIVSRLYTRKLHVLFTSSKRGVRDSQHMLGALTHSNAHTLAAAWKCASALTLEEKTSNLPRFEVNRSPLGPVQRGRIA